MITIHYGNAAQHMAAPSGFGKGLVPRDYGAVPVGSKAFAPSFDLPLIPQSQWQSIIDRKDKEQSWLDDIRNIGNAGKRIPSRDQGQSNYCFPAGTLIRMADGSQKPIERVAVTEKVLTAEGNIGRVLKTMVRDVSEPIHKLLLWGHSHLRATSEHPILTKRGYIQIKDLVMGDEVAIPKYAPSQSSVLMPMDYLYERNAAHQSRYKYKNHFGAPCSGSNYEVGIPGKRTVSIRTKPIPDAIQLTVGFGRLAGFYLAEGHTGPASVYFSFNVTEEHTFAAECTSLLRSELGCEPHVRIRGSNKSVCQVCIHGTAWARLFDMMFGRGADAKSLCADLLAGSDEFRASLLSGWIDGDRYKGESAVTVSRQLAAQMFDIANSLGRRPMIGTHGFPGVRKDGITRKHSWYVRVDNQESYRCKEEDKCLWRTVRGTEQEDYSGPVFNLEVEGDHSYVAEGVGVHNCWAHSGGSAHLLVRAMNGEPYADFSPYAVGCMVKGFSNSGGWGLEGVEFEADRGIPTTEFWPFQSWSRANNNAATWQNAANNKIETWMDLQPRNVDQMVTCLLQDIPVVVDYNWWSHSVCACRVVKLQPLTIRIWNSWSDSYGDNGMADLQGSHAIPDGQVAPRVVYASVT